MGSILRRETNIFERIERNRQAALVASGLVEAHNIQTIIVWKIKMIFLDICYHVAEELEAYQKERAHWEGRGYVMWPDHVEAERRLRKNYNYFLEIVEPHDLQIGFLGELNAFDSVGLLEEYKQLGRRVWFTIQIPQTIKTFN